jgi:hypothetical protein
VKAPFEEFRQDFAVAIAKVHCEMEVTSEVALCHNGQMHRINKIEPHDEILHLLTDAVQFHFGKDTNRLLLFKNALISFFELFQLFLIIGKLLEFKPLLHLALAVVYKTCSHRNPADKYHKSHQHNHL